MFSLSTFNARVCDQSYHRSLIHWQRSGRKHFCHGGRYQLQTWKMHPLLFSAGAQNDDISVVGLTLTRNYTQKYYNENRLNHLRDPSLLHNHLNFPLRINKASIHVCIYHSIYQSTILY